MRFLTWNCNGAFRKKFSSILHLDADILVIQECEDPAKTSDTSYRDFAHNYLWVGPTKNKGIGIFSLKDAQLEKVPLAVDPLELFLPCIINSKIPLLAAWTRQANSPNFQYIGQLWKFIQSHGAFLDTPFSALIGDLNSNSRWDEWDRWWNHSDVVRDLSKFGLRSAYHEFFNLPQGEELHPTLYLQRELQRPYHIDYGFFSASWEVSSVGVGEPDQWLEYSDHMPVWFDVSL